MPKPELRAADENSIAERALVGFEVEAQRLARSLAAASDPRKRASAARSLGALRARIKDFVSGRGAALDEAQREYLGVAIREIDNTIAALGRAPQRGTA